MTVSGLTFQQLREANRNGDGVSAVGSEHPRSPISMPHHRLQHPHQRLRMPKRQEKPRIPGGRHIVELAVRDPLQ